VSLTDHSPQFVFEVFLQPAHVFPSGKRLARREVIS
jgi:hypothetical protein